MFRAIRRKKSENGLKRPTAGVGAVGERAPATEYGRSTYNDRIVYAIDTSIEFSISRETTSERPGLTAIYVSMHSSGSQASPLLSQQYPKGLPRDPHLSDRSTPVRTGSTRRAPAYLW